MQPIGQLMIEHRLIERMLALIAPEVTNIEQHHVVNQSFIDTMTEFFRSYADWTHHGKEEEILFKRLSEKKISDADNHLKDVLIQEHQLCRMTTDTLVKATHAFQKSDTAALPLVSRTLHSLCDFYPQHIAKEDKVFFPAAMSYFLKSEQQEMLDEFWEFDRKMIHLKYIAVIQSLER
jgi:hemerythrin-like domain-containing protein